jgi:predicted Zn-dependent peptidase
MRLLPVRNPIASAGRAGSLLVLLLAGCLQLKPATAPSQPGLPHRPEELPPLDSLVFSPPEPVLTELPNGIRLYVLEDHALPLVSVDMLIRNGSQYDPLEMPGLCYFTNSVMRRGGAVDVQGDAFDDTLDFLAAPISVETDPEFTNVQLGVMRKGLDAGLSLLAKMLLSPAMPEAKLEETKRLMREAIRRRNDDPYEVGRRRFRQVVYGMDNPWARQMELADVDKITLADLVAFHRAMYKPNITYVAVSGDISTGEAVQKIRDAFRSWERADVPEPVLPPAHRGAQSGVYVVEKQVTQSAIRMGSVGMERHCPDEYAVAIMNDIFGAETFTSRLGLEVRSNRGLAYYVFGAVYDSPDPRQGMFLAVTGTRADKTHEAITVMKGIIDSMSVLPITDEEMRTAKETIVNSFVFQYASAEQIVGQQMRLAFNGYPEDYLRTYIPYIRAVTKDDVRGVAEKYLCSGEMRILVVGDPSRFDAPLDAFGPVTVLPPDDPVEATAR